MPATCREGFCCWMLVAALLVLIVARPAGGAPAGSPLQSVTNIAQLSRLGSQNPDVGYFVHLEGDLLWVNPARGQLVLQDASGAEELEMDLHGQSLQPGQRVRLEGEGTITSRGAGFRLGVQGPVVDSTQSRFYRLQSN